MSGGISRRAIWTLFGHVFDEVSLSILEYVYLCLHQDAYGRRLMGVKKLERVRHSHVSFRPFLCEFIDIQRRRLELENTALDLGSQGKAGSKSTVV